MALTTEIKYGDKVALDIPSPDGESVERVVIEPIRKSGRSVRLRIDADKHIKITRI